MCVEIPTLLSLPPPCNILSNPVLPDSLAFGRLLPWLQTPLFQLRNLVHPVSCKFHTFATLQEKFSIPQNLFYFYLQIRHFFHSLSPTLTLDVPTPFEHLCAEGPHQLHLISSIYHILHESTQVLPETHLYMRKWSVLLGRSIPMKLWAKIWVSTFKSSKCVAQRETAVKILMFWYRTPERIYHIDPSLSSRCWRCGTETGSHFHIFWTCSLMQAFWIEIQRTLQSITGLHLPFDPIHYLLGLPFPGISKPTKRLISYILLAAKRVIPVCWLSTTPPSHLQFLQTVAEIRRMEFLTAMVHDLVSQFNKIWEPWDQSQYRDHVS